MMVLHAIMYIIVTDHAHMRVMPKLVITQHNMRSSMPGRQVGIETYGER